MRTKSKRPASEERSFIETARRAQIVACAIDAIVELGFARASVNQIAKRAGVSKGVISYHFPSKDELTRKIVAGVFAAGRAFMEPRIRAAATATGRLRTYIESNLAFMDANRRPVMALVEIAASARNPDGTPLVGAESLAERVSALEELLRAGQKSGEFRRFKTRVMALAIVQSIDGVAPLLAREPGLDLARYGKELATLFTLATRKEAS